MIIGHKEDFAVEYSIANNYPNNMGYGRIWVKNKFIGTYLDLIFIVGYLLGTLNEFKKAKELTEDLRHLSKEQLFNLLFSGQNNNFDKYRVRGSTFTDDFSIWTYRIDNMTIILWQIRRTDFFDDLKDYKKDIFLENVTTSIINKVISELEAELKKEGILKV